MEFSLNQLAEKLSESYFDRAKGYGFEMEDLGRRDLSAIHVEEKRIKDRVQFPNGEEEVFERSVVVYTKFSVIEVKRTGFFLVVTNPPVSIKGLFEAVEKLAGVSWYMPLAFAIEKFLDRLKMVDGVLRSRVSKVWISSVRLSDDSIAKMSVESSSDALKGIVKDYSSGFKVDKAEVSFRYKGDSRSIVVASSSFLISEMDLLKDVIIPTYIQVATE